MTENYSFWIRALTIFECSQTHLIPSLPVSINLSIFWALQRTDRNPPIAFFLIYDFIYLCFATLGLFCFAWAFSSCSQQGLCIIVVCRLLIVGASLSFWSTGSMHVAFSSFGSQTLERKLRGCDPRAWLLPSMWDLPRPGIEPISPVLAGRFLSTVSPAKSRLHC